MNLEDASRIAAATTMDSEAYTLITISSHHQNYEDYVDVKSGKSYDLNVYLQAALRRQYPELALTVTVDRNGISFLSLPPPSTLAFLLI